MDQKLPTGAEKLVQCLEREGVEYIFGLSGGAAMPIFDALVDSEIKLILTRHEQGATHMADGYARATGRPGVVLVTSGPGATNTVTGLLTALMDLFIQRRKGGTRCSANDYIVRVRPPLSPAPADYRPPPRVQSSYLLP